MAENHAALRVFAEEIRLETLREIMHFGAGHVGGSMSVVELLAVLYGAELRHDPERPDWADRDRFILSKGHAGPALYAALALRGFFPMDMLKTLNQNGTTLPSHCDRLKTPGIDMTAGSLGQGLSVGIGMAMGARMAGKDFRTYVCLGDGECNEGQVWEAALFAPHNRLNNLTAFVDYNHQQLDGLTDEVLDLGDLEGKFRAFGWHTLSVDGHDIPALIAAVEEAKGYKDGPTMIVLNTIKGNGCLAAEAVMPNHHVAFTEENRAVNIAHAEARLEAAKKAAEGGAK
ncbi:transketolase [Oscillospiraceae bacterium OttesenSCG-928-F05]|nr:transketolase [Oscillospiraceae bacterium OttesenSCG-928-F05]